MDVGSYTPAKFQVSAEREGVRVCTSVCVWQGEGDFSSKELINNEAGAVCEVRLLTYLGLALGPGLPSSSQMVVYHCACDILFEPETSVLSSQCGIQVWYFRTVLVCRWRHCASAALLHPVSMSASSCVQACPCHLLIVEADSTGGSKRFESSLLLRAWSSAMLRMMLLPHQQCLTCHSKPSPRIVDAVAVSPWN